MLIEIIHNIKNFDNHFEQKNTLKYIYIILSQKVNKNHSRITIIPENNSIVVPGIFSTIVLSIYSISSISSEFKIIIRKNGSYDEYMLRCR